MHKPVRLWKTPPQGPQSSQVFCPSRQKKAFIQVNGLPTREARRPDWIAALEGWGFDEAALGGEEEPMHQGSNRTNSTPQNLKTPSRMRQFSTKKGKKKKKPN